MKLRFRLTIIIALLMATTIATICVILLRQARILQTNVASENLRNLGHGEAILMQQRFEIYMDTINAIAKIYNSFERIEMSARRTYFDSIILSTLESNPGFIGIYSVWKPGIIDNGNPVYSTLYTREHSTREREIITRYDFSTWNVPEYTRCQAAIAANEKNQWMISFPVPFVNRGVDTHVVFMAAPIISNTTGELYGFVGVGVDLAPIKEYIDTIKPFGIGRARLISEDGTVVGHPDHTMIGQNFRDVGAYLYGPHGIQELEDSIKSGNFHFFNHNGNMIVSYPIEVGTVKTHWMIVMDVSERIVLAEVYQMQIFAITISIIMVLVIACIIFFIITYTVKPITNVANTLQNISQGEGDLTQRIPEKGKDEITDMSHYFNLTLEKIGNMVKAIKTQTAALMDIGNNLASQQSQSSSAMTEINANIQSITTRVQNQSASVTETNATMEQITVGINKLNDYIEKEVSSVAQSSSAIEEMLANIQSVTNTLTKNLENVEHLLSASDDGRSGLQGVSQDIQEISRESEGLLEINSVMQTIASQTNLLSMNAAIEAAHAGEAGRGFAVVADEIRKLAENSSVQSKTISTVLKKIKSSIDKITVSTDNVLKKFEAIDSSIKTVAQQEEDVRHAMEEQSAGSKQILDSIGNLNEVTNLVKNTANEMLEGSQQVISESKNLEMVTQEINGSMKEMAIGMDEINVGTNNISTISQKNRESIDILAQEVGRFKVE